MIVKRTWAFEGALNGPEYERLSYLLVSPLTWVPTPLPYYLMLRSRVFDRHTE